MDKCADFYVGDRVIYIGNDECGLRTGYTGTIKMFDPPSVGVEWDEDVEGHDLDGTCLPNHGWFVRAEFLEHINDINEEYEIEPASDSELASLFV